jgi:tRNA(Ile)-lysidine synthetase-like protein
MMSELKNKFIELYEEWFHNKAYWFAENPEIDKYLSDKYFGLIRQIHEYNNELCGESIPVLLGAIIAFDQIPRHYKRIDISIDCMLYTEVAVKIALFLMIQCSQRLEVYDQISAIEWCFILLPVRHTKDCLKILSIIDFILKKHNGDCDDKDKAVYKRFIQATIEKIYRKITCELYVKPQEDIYNIEMNECEQWNEFGSVLQHIPVKPIDLDRYDSCDDLMKEFKEEIKYVHNYQNIIVSLSGGVDSCVCLYLIKMLMPYHNVTAVHINYNNREESSVELQFVEKLCAVLNVKLFYRTIDEITRNNCHQKGLRDLYEKVTRDIRFDMYKQVAATRFNDKILVVLGHNKDDCFENIITNISSKNSYDNLSGVSRLSEVDHIKFWRPLLNVRKKDIIHFAMSISMPFLQNSTPVWSARGKIRDVILPALQNINVDIMNSFFSLKDYVESSDKLIDTFVIKQITAQFVIENDTIIYECSKDDLHTSIYLWLKIFNQKVFMDFLGKQISHKSLKEFVVYLERFKENFDTIHVNKKIKYILKPDVHSIICKTTGKQVHLEFCCAQK